MTTILNPYYAHQSEVGPVVDVAKFSPAKSFFMGLFGLGFAAAIGAGLAYCGYTALAGNDHEFQELFQKNPVGAPLGLGIAALLGLLMLAVGLSGIIRALAGNYFIRAGEAGLSLRVPSGMFAVLERDIPWNNVTKLLVIQQKQAGSHSRNAGNVGGEIQLQTHDGLNEEISLVCFKEDAWLIYERILEARETRVAELRAD